MKTTSLEEMRIAMETYYEEIHRLQTLLASSETTGKKPPVERKTGLKKQRKVSSALLSLSRSVQELTEENQSLKEDLDRVLSSSPSAPGVQGYVEWSKPRLLRRIAELEKKINLMESAKPHAPELARSSPLTQPASSPVVPLAPPDEECERLRGALRSLRDERAALNAQLLDRGLEVKQLQQTKADLEQELRSVKESEKEGREREEALRVEIQTLTKKFQELEEIKKEEKDGPVEVTHEAPEEPPEEPPASHPASSRTQQDAEPDSGESCPSPSSRCAGGQEGRRREEAARLLQSRWKAHRHKKREAALDEAATVLQAAFRGHLARAKLLSGSACGAGSPSMPRVPSRGSPAPGAQSPTSQAACAEQEAITVIQSVFRAHLARTWQSAPSGRTATAAPPRPRSASAACRGAAAPLLAASPAQEDSGESGRGAAGEPAPQEEPRLSERAAPAAPQPCSEPPSGPPPATTPPLDDVHSDDSDDVISPSLPGKKAASPPRLRGQPSGGSSGHGQGARPLPST